VPVPKARRVTLTPELPSVTQSVAERLAAAAVSAPPDAATAETATVLFKKSRLVNWDIFPPVGGSGV
jgi:hypothetical protein